ncbi:Pyridoxine 5'-phosphate synthase [Cronobacter sakazakii 696]|nr:Pyridoxine 5'-phosphate synthase [Cronobacter sakazakii 696]
MPEKRQEVTTEGGLDVAGQLELERIAKAATYAASKGLKVNAGHGLTYHNVQAIAALPEMHELNIGHAIIGRAVMSGLKEAVSEMKRLMLEARR